MQIQNRTIFNKDNLDVLQGINTDSIDLIYLDPPFNKQREFTAPIGSSAEGASFNDLYQLEDIKDEWVESIEQDNPKLHDFLTGIKHIDGKKSYNYCYIAYMAIRLIECHRILKDTGSVYLHCDPTMSHYLKITLDCIFGDKNFRNEIAWQRVKGAGKTSQYDKKTYASNKDTILFYTKGYEYSFAPYIKIKEDEIIKKFNKIDDKGERYYDDSAHIFRPPGLGSRPNLCFEWRGFKNKHSAGWVMKKERLEEEYQKGNFVIQNGKLERRKYLKDHKGTVLTNIWTDIQIDNKEQRTGYPTQKPVDLLKRIITASSNVGDIVLDPFCGCATTCVAAEQLGRKWIGIDVSHMAYQLVKNRITKEVKKEVYDGNTTQTDLYGDALAIHFQTDAPKRTDMGADTRIQKYVYIISNPAYPNDYKVGIAKDATARLNSYQTSDPERGYTLEHSILTPHFNALEKHIHACFPNKHEWIQDTNLQTIIQEMDSFLAQKNTPKT